MISECGLPQHDDVAAVVESARRGGGEYGGTSIQALASQALASVRAHPNGLLAHLDR